MSKDYGYVSLPDMQYLLVGLAINVKRCADVLDGVLTAFNQKMGIPDQIVAWNVKGGNATGPLSFPDRGRFITELTQSLQSGGQELWTAALLEKHNEKEKAPVVFIRMHSPSLDIPTRLEIPLRALMKGGPPLEGTYCVYLHALLVDDGTGAYCEHSQNNDRRYEVGPHSEIPGCLSRGCGGPWNISLLFEASRRKRD